MRWICSLLSVSTVLSLVGIKVDKELCIIRRGPPVYFIEKLPYSCAVVVKSTVSDQYRPLLLRSGAADIVRPLWERNDLTHQIDGDDEVVLLPLSLLLVLASLNGSCLWRDLNLSFLSRGLLCRFRGSFCTRRHLLPGRKRCFLTRGSLLVDVTHSICWFVASLSCGK